MNRKPRIDRLALLRLAGWFGRVEYPVVIVGETPKRYRIQCAGNERIRLAGRERWLAPGATALVPKHAAEMQKPRTAQQGMAI